MNAPIVEFKNVGRAFGNIQAVDNVSLSVYPGEVLALLGENGAGKSTLMKLLYGIHAPTEGEILLRQKPSPITRPAEAMSHGVGMVFQHFSLLPALTVRDNLLAAWPATPFWIGRRNAGAAAALANLQCIAPHLKPDARLAELSVGEQQLVELCKVMNLAAEVVILDEPTSVLTPEETKNLHRFVRRLAADGVAVVFITHKLADVQACADRLAIMRRGRLVETVAKSQMSKAKIVSLMMGGAPANALLEQLPLPVKRLKRLQLVNLCAQMPGSEIQNFNLAVHAGEILAVAGVAGNGQTLLAEAVAGVTPLISGDVVLDGLSIARLRPEQTFCTPLGYIPEQPKDNGLVGELSLADNLQLRVFSGQAPEQHEPHALLANFGVNPPHPHLRASALSGGNAQKLVIARELGVERPAVLACYPTMGLDTQATARVYQEMFKQAQKGAAVLWISEDLDQMLRSAHRIAVIREGRLVALLVNDGSHTRESIGALMTDANPEVHAA